MAATALNHPMCQSEFQPSHALPDPSREWTATMFAVYCNSKVPFRIAQEIRTSTSKAPNNNVRTKYDASAVASEAVAVPTVESTTSGVPVGSAVNPIQWSHCQL
jgi:hypothetical protein